MKDLIRATEHLNIIRRISLLMIFALSILSASAQTDGKFTVEDTLKNSLTLRTTDNLKSNGMAFQNVAGDYTWNIFKESNGSNNANLVIAGGQANGDINLLDERFRIMADGKVGIGTSAPKRTLHVNGDYYGKGHVFLHAFEGDGQNGVAYLQARDLSGAGGSDIGLMLRTQSAGVLTEGLFVSPTGEVGVGTSTPSSKLHVNGVITETGGNSTNWNNAYGWGDHGSAGYLTTETDPIFTGSPSAGITGANIANWNTAFGWGDHGFAGYLTSFTEADPIFTASPSAGITGANIANWNTAFGWGDHGVNNLAANSIPKWNGSELENGLLSDDGSTVKLSLVEGSLSSGNALEIETVSGASTLDAQNTQTCCGLGAGSRWQSFTPNVSGALDKIELFLSTNMAQSGTLNIYQGEGTSGTLLSSQPYNVPSSGGGQWIEFILIDKPILLAGEAYTIHGSNIEISWGIQNPYADGRCSADPDYDAGFKTFIQALSTTTIDKFGTITALDIQLTNKPVVHASNNALVSVPVNAANFNLTPYTGILKVIPGDIVSISGFFVHRFPTGGSGPDPSNYKVFVEGTNGCTSFSAESIDGYAPPESAADHDNWMPLSYQKVFVSNCTGDYRFRIQITAAGGNDAAEVKDRTLVVRKN